MSTRLPHSQFCDTCFAWRSQLPHQLWFTEPQEPDSVVAKCTSGEDLRYLVAHDQLLEERKAGAIAISGGRLNSAHVLHDKGARRAATREPKSLLLRST